MEQIICFDKSTFLVSHTSVKSWKYPVTIHNDECKEVFYFTSSTKSLQFFKRLVEFVMDAETQILRHGIQPNSAWVDSEKFSVSDSGEFRIETCWETWGGSFQELLVTENPDGACQVFETIGQTK